MLDSGRSYRHAAERGPAQCPAADGCVDRVAQAGVPRALSRGPPRVCSFRCALTAEPALATVPKRIERSKVSPARWFVRAEPSASTYRGIRTGLGFQLLPVKRAIVSSQALPSSPVSGPTHFLINPSPQHDLPEMSGLARH